MSYTELLNAPTVSVDRDGQYDAVRSFRVYGLNEFDAIQHLGDNGVAILRKVSPHPRMTWLILDSISTTPSGPDTIVTLRYNNQNATGGDLDPLDDFFGTWSIGFRNVKYPIPRIQVNEAAFKLNDTDTQSTLYWDLADDFEISVQEVIFTWQGNDDGLSDGNGSVSLSLATAADVWKQAGKLHKLGLGGPSDILWRFEPRQVRQAIKGKFIVDYSWVLETDIRYEDATGAPVTSFAEVDQGGTAPNQGSWAANGTNSAIPLFPNPNATSTEYLLRPAYSTIIVSPNRSLPPSLTNAPTLNYVRTYGLGGDDGLGWKTLPGLIV
jgi:hypothetical protein